MALTKRAPTTNKGMKWTMGRRNQFQALPTEQQKHLQALRVEQVRTEQQMHYQALREENKRTLRELMEVLEFNKTSLTGKGQGRKH